ncbi:MAG: aromatic ring-hydroxylating dioxygenase subunit alpha [Gammaproteobacteria bacterium]|nr:aromatic ring-hydroxylating dioxygenase subunit alpha [Gammaproteobacteria bacterium]
MTVYRKIERFADPQSSRTPVQKEADPELGHDFIPAARYTSPEHARLEWQRMWTKVWLMGAPAQDLANPGDYVVTEIGTESIVLTRDEDGGLNAFYNVCSHRGNQVAYGSCGNTQTFRCSYHLWEYSLKGELINVPDLETFPQGAPCDRLSIKKLPVGEWGGIVWFSLNPDVEPLADYLGMIPEHLDPYHFEKMALVNDVTVEWNCNWKASVDAFNEAYHVIGTHPQLLTMLEDYDVQIDCYDKHSRYLIPFAVVSTHLEDGAVITDALKNYASMYGFDFSTYKGDGLGLRRALQKHLRKNAKSMGFDFSALNDDQLSDDYHYTIFPNITLNIHCNSLMLFRQRPHESDPNKMYFDLQNYALVGDGQTPPPRPVHRRFKHGEESIGEVLDQDASNLPMVQKGMNSSGYRGLWISNQELRVRHFHKTLDDYLYRDSLRWAK